MIDADGTTVEGTTLPPAEVLSELYRRMVIGRRFDAQATALTKQGRLAVYPSSRGQEACEFAAVLVLLGDGATSEGDTHEALNFAAVWQAPVVFLVQNNGFAISVPLAKQTAAPALAYKGVGYGVRSLLIDGNDAAAVYAAVRAALGRAAAGRGPT